MLFNLVSAHIYKHENHICSHRNFSPNYLQNDEKHIFIFKLCLDIWKIMLTAKISGPLNMHVQLHKRWLQRLKLSYTSYLIYRTSGAIPVIVKLNDLFINVTIVQLRSAFCCYVKAWSFAIIVDGRGHAWRDVRRKVTIIRLADQFDMLPNKWQKTQSRVSRKVLRAMLPRTVGLFDQSHQQQQMHRVDWFAVFCCNNSLEYLRTLQAVEICYNVFVYVGNRSPREFWSLNLR